MAAMDMPRKMAAIRGYVPQPVPKREGTKSKTTLALREIRPHWKFHVLDEAHHGQAVGTVIVNPGIQVFGVKGPVLHNRAQARQLGLKHRPGAARPPHRWREAQAAAKAAARAEAEAEAA